MFHGMFVSRLPVLVVSRLQVPVSPDSRTLGQSETDQNEKSPLLERGGPDPPTNLWRENSWTIRD